MAFISINITLTLVQQYIVQYEKMLGSLVLDAIDYILKIIAGDINAWTLKSSDEDQRSNLGWNDSGTGNRISQHQIHAHYPKQRIRWVSEHYANSKLRTAGSITEGTLELRKLRWLSASQEILRRNYSWS